MPEPEVKVSVVPMSVVQSQHESLPVMSQSEEEFQVQHHVKGNSVFVECMLSNISFRDHSQNKGKILLYVDGKLEKEIHTAAFIIKGLASGPHKIRLEVKKPNNEPYHLSEEFTVNIS